jgi:hypothetical protein
MPFDKGPKRIAAESCSVLIMNYSRHEMIAVTPQTINRSSFSNGPCGEIAHGANTSFYRGVF